MTCVTGTKRGGGRIFRRGGRLVAVAASVALLVAGCGTGTPSARTTTGTPTASASASAVSAGVWLASFHGTTVDGKAFDGATLAGKPTVLWFWAPWCPTCLMQALGVRDAIARSGKDVNIVGVAGLDKAAAMPEFVRLAKIAAMTSIADPEGTVWKRFHVLEQSYFVLLDGSGREVSRGKFAPDEIPGRVAALAG